MDSKKLERIGDILLYISFISLITSNIILTVKVEEIKKKINEQGNINEYILNRIEYR